uniref:Alternative oxidase n=1 Tax=Moniliophthora perniciosa TaxID=153609 RepID=A8QJP8_MONPR|nr:mitochondrial alternative oxidase [Moniliophthora perniciosa]AEL23664.1 mitochondrial alternative oxidase [Moniliophthora perniciosa]
MLAIRTQSTLARTVGTSLLRQSYIARYPLCRGISSSTSNRNSLTDEQAQAGTVGPHLQQRPTALTSAETRHQHGDAVVTGDWVLFHPVYSPEELKVVEVLHREATCLSDRVAAGLVGLCRWGYDFVTRYKHKTIPPGKNMTLAELRKEGYLLDDKAWLSRILFLESIAGVPGMVAATIRHLTSLRLMRRDNGWIHTCLEEAENERMHLMTFMTLRKPSIFFRAMILGAQGVFYNLFFLSYIISPRICHRFVGYLEEEAVLTYTKCIKDIEAGYVPEWSDMPAPKIAIDYWRLPADAKLLDVIYAVRSDETTHRFVNHSLANLNGDADVNPFALMEPDMHTKGKKIAFERSESEQYLKETHNVLREQHEAHPGPNAGHS